MGHVTHIADPDPVSGGAVDLAVRGLARSGEQTHLHRIEPFVQRQVMGVGEVLCQKLLVAAKTDERAGIGVREDF